MTFFGPPLKIIWTFTPGTPTHAHNRCRVHVHQVRSRSMSKAHLALIDFFKNLVKTL